MIVRASLRRDIRLNYQHISFLSCYMSPSVYVYQHLRQNLIVGGEENLPDIQVSVCYILKHFEDSVYI